MPLVLYRRRRRDCKSGHPEELRTSEYDERKKGWKRCECAIFVSGTLEAKFKRQNTGQWEWEDSKLIAAKWETCGSWSAPNAVAAPAGTSQGRATSHQRRRCRPSLFCRVAKIAA